MLKTLKTIGRILTSYTLEERVISAVVILALFFAVFRLIFFSNVVTVLADDSLYSEAIVSDKPTLVNPLYVDFSQSNRDISSLVFSSLMKFDPTLNNFVADLGDLTVSEDKKTYLFKLKQDVKWHDGKVFDADDVLFTFNDVIKNPAFQNPILKANFDGVTIEKVDQFTVKFILTAQNSFFVSNLNVGILPKHLLAEIEVNALPSNEFNIKPIGTGPYQVDSALEKNADGKQKLTLKEYDGYYGKKPSIKRIRFLIYPDETSLIADLSSINVIARWNHSPNETQLREGRFKPEKYTLPQYSAIFFNTESKILKDTRIRLALQKSLNKPELIAKLQNKVAIDSPLFGLKSEKFAYKYDLKAASGALFDAGYTFLKDPDGSIKLGEKYRKNAKGEILEFKLLVRAVNDDSPMAEEMEIITDNLIKAWGDVGVKLNLEVLPEEEFMDVLKTKEYDMILTGQSLGYNFDIFPFWHSSQTGENGLNLSNFKSFAADQQIEKLRETFDPTERTERLKKLSEVFEKEVPAIFLYSPEYFWLSDGKLKNVHLTNFAYPADRFANVSELSIL